jgi:hypothetical protein
MATFRSFRETQPGKLGSSSDIRPRRSTRHPAASFVADQQRSYCDADVFGAVENFIRHDYVLRTYREALVTELREIPLISPRIAKSTESKAA